MRIIVAELSAVYSGRGESYLAPYRRIVMYKADGSVSIHNDTGYKPLNYMMAPTTLEETFEEDELTWTIVGKNESLIITFHEIFDTVNLDLGMTDPGLVRESTEHHLQKWLTENIPVIDEDATLVSREFQTGSGPVDLLLEKFDDSLIAVEVKRVAPMNTVGQILRYVDALEEKFPDKRIVGVIAAVEFKTSTLEIAKKKNIECVLIPEQWKEEAKEGPKDPFAGTLFKT